jgi:hypothetical protein
MFRSSSKFEREVASSRETGQRPVLNYREREEEDEPRRGFWPDREGWKDLIGTFMAELIAVPLLIIAALWIWLRFFSG